MVVEFYYAPMLLISDWEAGYGWVWVLIIGILFVTYFLTWMESRH